MDALNYRRIEQVSCAGIPISTWLSDDRQQVMVSVSDLAEQLAINVNLEDLQLEEYVTYDMAGRQHKHMAIPHRDINHFLWDFDAKYEDDLDEFRRYFSYEVMSFWQRFQNAAASLSVRDAVKVMDRKCMEYQDHIGVPPGRVFQMAFTALGYQKVPLKENMTTEELAFVAYSELLYTTVTASEIEAGHSHGEAMRLAEERLLRPLKEIGYITRGVSGV